MDLVISWYFDNIFYTSNPTNEGIGTVLEGIVTKVSPQTSFFLDTKFSGEEVRKAVLEMSLMKAPGRDGYQNFWDRIGPSVVEACLGVVNHGDLVESINSTIITLIPKIHTPESSFQFRPISLCNVLYKIIAKTIVSRFRKALDGVISET
ncbi:hypothetical protein Dsin_001579 [Dipteronia sinensis]|uniref:Reverse transcriptase domain-containing protein n=1 Tax=Dipteronia sinensis TaxID=43782 RepID=A0AAE0B528_9ROSI|nr:hypothetical protein Dsin_001579 [Dipteronia sinensis]